MNYREESTYKKKKELKENELKKKMAAALTDAKAKVPSKESSSSSAAPPEGTGREVITLPNSDLSAESPTARQLLKRAKPAGPRSGKLQSPHDRYVRAQSPELRKRLMKPLLRRVPCPRPRVLLTRRELRSANFQIAEASLETYQDKVQLAGDLYLKSTTAETEAKKELQEIKLRNQLLEAGNSSEMERVRREERRKTQAKLRDTIDKIGALLEDHDRLILHAIRAAEITANQMLVEEIEKGEIADLKDELETLKADKRGVCLEAEKVKDLTFHPASFCSCSPYDRGATSDSPVVPNQELEAIQSGLSKEVFAPINPGGGEALAVEATGAPLARSEDHAADSELA
ncbi:uncharacterized protein LOC111832400 [Capsella rubella]|uniref:uncharacterized protein LOC111832400 n=1 Tax=Capsella rubella TaxID=81985 RepID=UPI000CD4DC12|nr:uncharacterized protein LOC111832400 [Capsella rubella]